MTWILASLKGREGIKPFRMGITFSFLAAHIRACKVDVDLFFLPPPTFTNQIVIQLGCLQQMDGDVGNEEQIL